MTDFRNEISQFIQSQFPEHYREQAGVDITETDRELIIDFTEAYYEFVEANYSESWMLSRQMPTYRDIDTTLDAFVKYFRSKYLANMAYVSATDERFIIKHIIDLYRAKGSEAAVKLLIRLLFNTDATVYVPGKDVFRASDSVWYVPTYVETLTNPRNRAMLNQRIFGSISNASAFVEGVVTKRVAGRLIDIIYLSDIEGTFVFDDRISTDGDIINAPRVIGSLTSVTLDVNSVGGFAVGDLVNIESSTGRKGVGIVRSVLSQTGQVVFTMYYGGFGYTTGPLTKQYVSDLIIEKDNANTVWAVDDTVTQQLEKIYLETGSTFADEVALGEVITGQYANTQVANGVIVKIDSELVLGVTTDTITIQVEDNTFRGNQILDLSANATFIVDEVIEEGSEITLEVANTTGTFANGETLYWKDTFAEANNISETFGVAEVVSANSTVVTIEYAFGTWNANTVVRGYDTGYTATIVSANVTNQGATGTLLSQPSSNQVRILLAGEEEFTANNKIYGTTSKVRETIANTTYEGTLSVATANTSANVQSTLTSDVTFTGVVVGQNAICIGVANTSSNPFIFVANTSILKNQDAVAITVEDIASGTGARTSIKAPLENVEEFSLSLEMINYENVFGISVPSIKISGEGSGVGYVSDVTVVDGGSGYTNGASISVMDGGYEDQDVIFPARGHILTAANGEILDVVITDEGEGYFTSPTVSVSGGTGANLEPVMVYGYGFSSEVLANPNTVIADVLTTSNVSIGTIAELTSTKGTGYDRKPFVRFVNSSIASYGVQDQILIISPLSGALVVGDIITQANTSAKGIIKSKTGTSYRIGTLTMQGYFTTSGGIVSANTGATGTVTSAIVDSSAELIGENADIQAFIAEEQGIIDNLEITNSGYGYIPGQAITITANGETITGTASVEQQGIGQGYWKTRTSFISAEKKLHDNNYYQEFSYEVRADRSFSNYSEIVLNMLHLAGTKLFGKVIKNAEVGITLASNTVITQS